MSTEQVSARFDGVDVWPLEDTIKALYEGQLAAIAAVSGALSSITGAADAAGQRLQDHSTGRLIYVGAGTSGRIGVQDGAELVPTFNWPEDRLLFALAGGERAVLQAIENAEDAGDEGELQIARAKVGAGDVVIGVAASGTTTFTRAAMDEARRRGALTIGVANNRDAPLFDVCDHPILVETGEEVIAGSTRMKAGTAQKAVLNILSTAIMIRLGRVYRGLMVDVRPTNEKLRRRSQSMVATLARCSESDAAIALAQAGDDVKLASLLASGFARDIAEQALHEAGGNLRTALAMLRTDLAADADG